MSEEYAGGTLAGMNIQHTLDSLLRRASVSARHGTTVLAANSYTYDNASRLTSLGGGTYSAQYSYLANSPLVSQITFKQNSTTRMTSTRHYDFLNHLGSISFVPNYQLLSPISYFYTYKAANQRTRVTLGDLSAGQANGGYWLYEYDTLGQVRSGKRYWNDHMPVPGQQFEYGFDDIGNRAATQTGGDSEGAGLRASTYTANLLNQYSQRNIPASFDVLGVANAAQTVTLNGSAADYRRGEYFQENVAVSNGSTAVWQSVSVTTSGGGSGSGAVFVPKTPEIFTHDLDGNGNVVALIDGGTGQTDTHYEYGPFGETLRTTGAMATTNPFRFSTKYTDGETDLVYYGHQSYNSSTGRRPSRDPIEERGGLNFYAFVGNDPIRRIDPFGRESMPAYIFKKCWESFCIQ